MTKVCYHGGSSFEVVGLDLQAKDQVIRADVTDAWYDPAPGVIDALQDLPWLLKNSPPTNAEGLVKVISECRVIPPDNILVGGGSSDLMFTFFPNIQFGDATILDPMYGEYAHIIERVLQRPLQRIFQRPEHNFEINLDDIVKSAKSDIVILVNPNNPTGQYLRRDQVLELRRRLPQEVILVVDETYIDYCGADESIENQVAHYKNLVVIKSMSKIYALSGARVGYIVAHTDVIDQIRPYNPPWSVSLLGQVAAVQALKSSQYYKDRIDQTHALRNDFAAQLSQIPGVKVYPSCTNFLLAGFKETGKTAQQVYEELRNQQIYIRDPSSMSQQLGQHFIRTAVKDSITNQKIYNALAQVCK